MGITQNDQTRMSFLQDPPRIGNEWENDTYMQSVLRRLTPNNVFDDVKVDLGRFGERVATDVLDMGDDANVNLPTLQPFDSWGRRVDKIHTSKGWRMLHDLSAEEGIVSIAYERRHKEFSRLHWAVKLYLFGGSAALYTCPLAMTDGAARAAELTQDEWLKQTAFPHLTSRDAKFFWTSGQWMTERAGGSDVSRGTETFAKKISATEKQEWATHRLFGVKWFSSATDCDMTLALARELDDVTGKPSGRLTLFFVPLRDDKGALNHIEILRLKDKLGTRQLPTAELKLDGVLARKVSEQGQGVKTIVTMVNVTRVWNSICAISAMRRTLSLARDYSARRSTFGKLICEHTLHIDTLAQLEVQLRACTQLVMEVVRLMGRVECNVATPSEQHLFRLLTPVTKLYTGKRAVNALPETMEAIGGQAYVEDSGIPAHVRDTHVLPVWEGTTNVLSLDVLRAIQSSQGESFKVFCTTSEARLAAVGSRSAALQPQISQITTAIRALQAFVQHGGLAIEHVARDFAFSIGRVAIGVLLVEHGSWEHSTASDTATLMWFLQAEPLVSGLDGHALRLAQARDIVGHVTKVEGNQYRPYGPGYRSQL
eukprot:c4106_g1_i2.p1 GENE.c4106_g1_i2~~c4106_g1_i2.p1  ORF type:complete len:597 (-),score=142.57 c4106_g1_i2:215-2005(-)